MPHHLSRTLSHSRNTRPRRLRFESLEHRRVLANLAFGVAVFEDGPDDSTPGVRFDPATDLIEVGDTFWVGILVQDQRAGQNQTPGVVSLPINVDWDSDVLSLTSPSTDGLSGAMGPLDIGADNLLITSRFSQSRLLSSFSETPSGTFDFVGLQGGAFPNAQLGQALGQTAPDSNATDTGALSGQLFSLFRMSANAETEGTPITIQLAGGASVADGDRIDAVVPIESFLTVAANDVTNAVRAALPIATDGENATLTGSVYADVDFDGRFEANEFGIPGVVVTLRDANGATVSRTTTGPDGGYRFVDLAPGTYRLEQTQPDGFADASIAVGRVLPDNVTTGTADGLSGINSINLDLDQSGVDYHFGESLVDVTKRMYLSSTDPRQEFCLHVGIRCGAIEGTDGDDVLTVRRASTGLLIEFDGRPPLAIPADAVDQLFIDLGDGNDTVLFDDEVVGSIAANAYVEANTERSVVSLHRRNDNGVGGQVAVSVFDAALV
ncbi:MAG: SdrD B-like domain-containing protein [Planctomycetota bacterium]